MVIMVHVGYRAKLKILTFTVLISRRKMSNARLNSHITTICGGVEKRKGNKA